MPAINLLREGRGEYPTVSRSEAEDYQAPIAIGEEPKTDPQGHAQRFKNKC